MINKNNSENRVIGERVGGKQGPLLIIFAQIHGNEPAGYKAVNELFASIDAEYVKNPDFDFCGRIVALRGNVKAAALGVRYIDKDLNRSWLPANVERIKKTNDWSSLDAEDQEIKANLELIDDYIKISNPTRVVVLDLHSTTAHGGIFTIPATDNAAREIGLSMHAPVLHGFLEGLKGTTLHYFCKENFGIDITAVCFEAGQHQGEDSHKHAISAIISCFKFIGGFYEKDIESKHHQLLQKRAEGLPLEAKLEYIHTIKKGDDFRMTDTKIYSNFDSIQQGEILAYDKNGSIKSPCDGLILMPLYQKQGEDGFFVIREIMPKKAKNLEEKKVLGFV